MIENCMVFIEWLCHPFCPPSASGSDSSQNQSHIHGYGHSQDHSHSHIHIFAARGDILKASRRGLAWLKQETHKEAVNLLMGSCYSGQLLKI